MDFLVQHVELAADRWRNSINVDEARGTIIYTYIGQDRSINDVMTDTKKLLRIKAEHSKVVAIPIIVLFLNDMDGTLGQSLSEYAVLDEIPEAEKVKFGNLVGVHREKVQNTIREKIESMLKERTYITALEEEIISKRISRVGTEIFEKIYVKLWTDKCRAALEDLNNA